MMFDCVANHTRSKTQLLEKKFNNEKVIIDVKNTVSKDVTEVRSLLENYASQKSKLSKSQQVDHLCDIYRDILPRSNLLKHNRFRKTIIEKYFVLLGESNYDERMINLLPEIMDAIYNANK